MKLSNSVVQMDDGDLFAIVLFHFAVSIVDLDTLINGEHEDCASFAKKHFLFVWVRCVAFTIHSNSRYSLVVLASNDEKNRNMIFLRFIECELEGHNRIFRTAVAAWKEYTIFSNFLNVRINPFLHHW